MVGSDSELSVPWARGTALHWQLQVATGSTVPLEVASLPVSALALAATRSTVHCQWQCRAVPVPVTQASSTSSASAGGTVPTGTGTQAGTQLRVNCSTVQAGKTKLLVLIRSST